MSNCNRAAEYLARAYLECDDLKQLISTDKDITPEVQGIKEYLKEFFKHVSDSDYVFERFAHDITNLENQANQSYPNHDFVRRYTRDLQIQILSEGIVSLIDCKCNKDWTVVYDLFTVEKKTDMIDKLFNCERPKK